MDFEPHSRVIVSICMLILSAFGICLVWINSWVQQSPKRKQLLLNQMLWKFNQISPSLINAEEQRATLYKLICVGAMIACVVVSFLVKIIYPLTAIWIGIGILICWAALLIFFWFTYVNAVAKADSKEDVKGKVLASDIKPASFWDERTELFKKDENDPRLPITIVTGFLGSGKTTLIKRILSNTVGLKVLVIENEIGSEGIDHELLLQSTNSEEIILLNNGCICCTGKLLSKS
jgi:small-conductance mechanosensitive channel